MSVRRSRLLLLAGVAVLVLAMAAFLATGLGKDHSITASPLVGRDAPDFHLQGLDGSPTSAVGLSDLRGQVAVVNFWASWCAECRLEQADLDQTWRRFRESGVVVLGVNFQDATGDARQYVAESGSSYPMVSDKDSTTALAYGLRGVPETFIVDQEGQIVERFIGPVTADRLSARISPLLAGGAR
jgi:cytochrome c biogenesis protein CcmG, thiol:disulfide interchange protein DsbE